jgi:hypothetical protein
MNNRLLLLIASVLFFTSCTMHEEIDLAKEGNGFYQVHVDMSPMMEMMKGMSGTNAVPDSIAKEVRDTTFSLASMIDSAGGNFTAEEKAYFYNATMQMKMDMPSSKMEVFMKFPVKNAADLRKLFAVWSKVDSLNEIKKNKKEEVALNQPPKVPTIESGSPVDNITNPGELPFKPSPYIITDTSIQRTSLTKEDIMKDMGETGQGALMAASQMNYTATIKLARPVKKLTGKNVKLSDDKRTVFYSASLQELLDDPTAGEFLIIY